MQTLGASFIGYDLEIRLLNPPRALGREGGVEEC